MFLDKIDNRREVEEAYRKELQEQINRKISKPKSKPLSEEYSDPSKFGLLASIQKQEFQRKKKKEDYYDELRKQMDHQKNQKSKAKKLKEQMEAQQDAKLQRENQMLRQRYEQELSKERKNNQNTNTPLKENSKKVERHKSNSNMMNVSKKLGQQEMDYKPRQQEMDYQPRQQEIDYKPRQHELDSKSRVLDFGKNSWMQQGMERMELNLNDGWHPAQVDSQRLNYVPKYQFKTNHFQELHIQRRRMEEESALLSQLNRIFTTQKHKKKEENTNLEALKNLQNQLEQKNISYMNQSWKKNHIDDPSKQIEPKYTKNRTYQDSWRKLD